MVSHMTDTAAPRRRRNFFLIALAVLVVVGAIAAVVWGVLQIVHVWYLLDELGELMSCPDTAYCK